MSVLCTVIWVHPPDFAGLETQLAGHPRGRGFGLRLPATPPRHECASNPQQRRGIFDDDI